MARIAAAFEECGSDSGANYTSRGEAATLYLGLPLRQVYSQLFCNILLFSDLISLMVVWIMPNNVQV